MDHPPRQKKSIISLTEITDIIKTQKQLEESISEKNALLRELHHRVKNNLQVIISLLNLQAQKADKKSPTRSPKPHKINGTHTRNTLRNQKNTK